MLTNTFLHIPGVGEKTERKIWDENALTWNSFLSKRDRLNLSPSKKKRLALGVEKSLKCHENEDYRFLIDKFPNKIHWRAYNELKERRKVCFLDIETTGLDRNGNEITVIGLYNGNDDKFFINGRNLKEFKSEIKNYDMIVSFNGKCFDVPFIERNFQNLKLKNNYFHVDLRYEMKKLGYSGGLKSIERDLGVSRSEETQGISGYEAVILWKKYREGDDNALRRLIEYNREDIENLENLMEFSYRKLKKREFSN